MRIRSAKHCAVGNCPATHPPLEFVESQLPSSRSGQKTNERLKAFDFQPLDGIVSIGVVEVQPLRRKNSPMNWASA
jgi:hypothetical protein